MTTYFRRDEYVEGDEIFFCFGVVPPPKQGKGGRVTGILDRHGEAVVLRPLRRARIPQYREQDSIRCTKAVYECSDFTEKGKQTYGAHRGIAGYLCGNARATIRYPMENIPDAAL
jgi:hypothetical protein